MPPCPPRPSASVWRRGRPDPNPSPSPSPNPSPDPSPNPNRNPSPALALTLALTRVLTYYLQVTLFGYKLSFVLLASYCFLLTTHYGHRSRYTGTS
eukprot:scaffold48831_cov36-Phaeocystis_antarctica.AAC.2